MNCRKIFHVMIFQNLHLLTSLSKLCLLKQWNCNGVGYCWCEKKILFFLILITMFSSILIYSRSNTVLMCTKNIFKTCHFTGKISHFVKTRSSLQPFEASLRLLENFDSNSKNGLSQNFKNLCSGCDHQPK